MKYYVKNRSVKARDVMLRIQFVIIAAAVITFAAILVGHHLLKKAESLGERPSDLSGAGWSPEKRETEGEDSAGNAPVLRGVGLEPLSYSSVDLLSSGNDILHHRISDDSLDLQLKDGLEVLDVNLPPDVL